MFGTEEARKVLSKAFTCDVDDPRITPEAVADCITKHREMTAQINAPGEAEKIAIVDEKSYRVVFSNTIQKWGPSDPNWNGPKDLEPRKAFQVYDETRLVADYFTVEPSGAATFWIRSPDGERSSLIVAYGAGVWRSIEMAS
jgi:hypothetical protein